MGNLWNAFVEGYNEAGPSTGTGVSAWDRLQRGVESTPDAQPKSPWDSLIQTHTPGDGFYSDEEGGTKVDPDYIRAGLVKRGLPEHIAEGFVMNMGDESGFDAGINEISPLVPGSRGGFGLYQLTGPRRRQYEAFAESQGVPVYDPDAQMDFLVWELENTEKNAAQSIFGTSTAGEAGAAIVNKFLRPAEEHRAKRASKYLGGSVTREAPRPQRLWLDF